MGRQINLTDLATGATISMNTSQIVENTLYGTTDTTVNYVKEVEQGAGVYSINVDESLATIVTNSESFIFSVVAVPASPVVSAWITYATGSGTFAVGEQVLINNATRAIVTADTGSVLKVTNVSGGEISATNTIVGVTSGASYLVTNNITPFGLANTPTTDKYTYAPAPATRYINAERIREIVAVGRGAMAKVYYDESGSIDAPINVIIADDAVADTIIALNLSVNGVSADVTLAGNNAFTGNNSFSGTIVQSNTTDSTSSTTGAFKTAGGVGVAKALFVGTTVNAGTSMTVGTDITGAKETAHVISVADSTTANTAGGALSTLAGLGTGTAAGGAIVVKGGASTNATTTVAGNSGAATISTGAAGTATTGTGGNGGLVSVTGVAGGAASGAAGIGGNGSGVTITTGAGGASSSATGGVAGTSGALTITAGNGGAAAGTGVAGGAATAATFTTGTGGASTHASGGAGGAGAALTITTGNGGAVTNAAVAGGVGGAIAIVAGNAGAGSTAGSAGGAVTLTGGNGVGTAGGPGNITLTPGTTSVTTVAPTVISSTAIIQKNTAAPFFLIGTTASDGAFAKSIVGGYAELRGATGNVQMPTAAQIVTAIGVVTAGTRFQFILNAIGSTPMTAGNTATVTANTGVVIDATVGNTLMTVTSTSNVNIGMFQITFDSATTCILSRM